MEPFFELKSLSFPIFPFQASIFKRHAFYCSILIDYQSLAENKYHEYGTLCKAMLLPGDGTLPQTLRC